jgi:perosamine synthetase
MQAIKTKLGFNKMIPVSTPKLNGNELNYVIEALKTGWISSAGKYIEQFEEGFSSYIGVAGGACVSNGTVAIETALFSIGIQEGDEIIMPSLTIISCAIGVLRLGAKPVLVDIDSETWNIDPLEIEKKITKKTKAIMVVHLFGHSVDMDLISEIAKKYNLIVIEDCSQAHGAEYKGKKCGSLGDIATFSFYANKIITTGEGGMVVSNNPKYIERAKSYRNLCFIKERRFFHEELGNNYRMTNLQAAIGCAQLENIEEIIQKKVQNWNYYNKYLGQNKEILRLQVQKEWAKSVYWMYSIEISEKLAIKADQLIDRLKSRGIETRPFFVGLHQQPVLKSQGLFMDENYPRTEFASDKCLYLPSSLELDEGLIKNICECVLEEIQ